MHIASLLFHIVTAVDLTILILDHSKGSRTASSSEDQSLCSRMKLFVVSRGKLQRTRPRLKSSVRHTTFFFLPHHPPLLHHQAPFFRIAPSLSSRSKGAKLLDPSARAVAFTSRTLHSLVPKPRQHPRASHHPSASSKVFDRPVQTRHHKSGSTSR